MPKIYTEKEKALADWDNQYEDIGKQSLDNTQIKATTTRLEDEELRAFIKETDGDMMEIAINMPSTKPLAYGMLLTMIEAIALNSGESFESVMKELTAMRESKIISQVS